MGQMRIGLRAYAQDGTPPGEVLARLNDLVRASGEREMATIAYLVLDPSDGRIDYAVAGHPPPLVIGPGGESRFLRDSRGAPVGVSSARRFDPADDVLLPGETLLLYTDGLVERRGQSLDEGLDELVRRATDAAHAPDGLCERLVEDLEHLADDVAVLAIRRPGTSNEPLECRVRAVPESLSAMRRSLAVWLVAAGAGEDDAYDVLLAVGEAAANAVEHAYGPVDAEFVLRAEAADGEVHVTVADNGRWRPARGANRGRGIDLMRQLMDEVDVTIADHGTVVRMRRALRREEGA
jgi:anti-sigma regulatory factor (Ser/Thr protein kinase)